MHHVVAEDSIPLISTLFSNPPFQLTLVPLITHSNIKDANILICRSTTRVDHTLLDNTTIKYVLTATSGTDHIDKTYLDKKGIVYIDAKGGNTQSVCDYVLALIAARQERIRDKTVGIIGVGEVGGRLANTLSVLGFKLKLCDPFKHQMEPDFKHEPLDNLSDCAIISLHVPYTKTGPYPTHHLIDKTFLNKLLPHTLLINTARGGVLDEKAILNLSKPMMLCLDVFEQEPLLNQPILSYCESATPHIAGHAYEGKLRSSLIIYKKLCKILSISNAVTPYDELLNDTMTNPTLAQYVDYYSSIDETRQLKARHSAESFLALRKAHKRHEFAYLKNENLCT